METCTATSLPLAALVQQSQNRYGSNDPTGVGPQAVSVRPAATSPSHPVPARWGAAAAQLLLTKDHSSFYSIQHRALSHMSEQEGKKYSPSLWLIYDPQCEICLYYLHN